MRHVFVPSLRLGRGVGEAALLDLVVELRSLRSLSLGRSISLSQRGRIVLLGALHSADRDPFASAGSRLAPG